LKKRVVITGLGIAAPNGVGLKVFTNAIKNGISGIKHDAELDASWHYQREARLARAQY